VLHSCFLFTQKYTTIRLPSITVDNIIMESLLTRVRNSNIQFSFATQTARQAVLDASARSRAQHCQEEDNSTAADHMLRIKVGAVPAMVPFRPSNALIASAARATRGESMALIGAVSTGLPPQRVTLKGGNGSGGGSMALSHENDAQNVSLASACEVAGNAPLWPRGLFADLVAASKTDNASKSSSAKHAIGTFRKHIMAIGEDAATRQEQITVTELDNFQNDKGHSHARAVLGLMEAAKQTPLSTGFDGKTTAILAELKGFRVGLQMLKANL
jgi:hypothetical protein